MQIDAKNGILNERFKITNYNLMIATERILELANLTGDQELMELNEF